MGGVSHPSQHYAVALLQPERVKIARKAIMDHYSFQRERYGKAFAKMVNLSIEDLNKNSESKENFTNPPHVHFGAKTSVRNLLKVQ